VPWALAKIKGLFAIRSAKTKFAATFNKSVLNGRLIEDRNTGINAVAYYPGDFW
tara:strand:- start:2709 stop:2870 length:162 start_codon:yes stop_codon:yes gene_type:complete